MSSVYAAVGGAGVAAVVVMVAAAGATGMELDANNVHA